MSVLDRLACSQGRRDEVPNQELARELADHENHEDIRELVTNVWHANQNVRSDCLKTLYEIGYLRPELIADYAHTFLELLRDKSNRMVWGAMLALATIAPLRAQALYQRRDQIQAAIAKGSVITVDAGIRVLAAVAAADDSYRHQLFPYLLEHLETCRPKDVPQHAEAIQWAVEERTRDSFVAALQHRMSALSPPQVRRVQRTIKRVQARPRA